MTELMYNNKLSETFQKTQGICRNLSFNGYMYQGIVISSNIWIVEFELFEKNCKIHLKSNEVKTDYQTLRSIIIHKIFFERIEY